MEQAYYTLEQSCKILQLSEATIKRKMKTGLIPRARFCGKILIPSWFFKEGFEKESSAEIKGEKENT